MSLYLVYKITNIKNQKSYVGITKKSTHHRLLEHKSHARCGSKYKFHLALNKYTAPSDWKIEVLENSLSFMCAKLKEIFYIQYFDTFRSGYNSTLGGEGSPGIKKNHTGVNNPMCGKKHSASSIQKNRESNIKYAIQHPKTHSEETKKQISDKKARLWEITFPSGQKIIIKNLTQFCKNNNLDQGHMSKVAQNKLTNHKKFLCKRI